MNCPDCGALRPANDRYCGRCGARLTLQTVIIEPDTNAYTVVDEPPQGHESTPSLARVAATVAAEATVSLLERSLTGRRPGRIDDWRPVRRSVVVALSGAILVLAEHRLRVRS
jgi:uncharacterized OB-fold protein